MDDAAKKEIIGSYIAAYNSFDVDSMLALLSPSICFENIDDDQVTASTSGADEFRRLAEQSKALFSEREQRILSLRLDSDPAVAMIAFSGRLAKDIPGGPSAGTILSVQGQSEFSFEAGRICRIVDRS